MSLTSASYRLYQRLSDWIVPGHRHTQRVYLDWLNEVLQPGCDWLDLGCGHQILPSWVGADEKAIVAICKKAVGIDLDFPSLLSNSILRDRLMGDLDHLPFSSSSFDVVTANMVFEHLEKPLQVLKEVHRVMRPGGRLLVHTPNRDAPSIRMAAATPERLKKWIIWMLERRKEEDVFPTHYQVNTPADIRRLAAESGFEVERIEQLSTTAVTAILGPASIPELFYIRMLYSDRFQALRSNLLFVLGSNLKYGF